jgi:hypothetical protein
MIIFLFIFYLLVVHPTVQSWKLDAACQCQKVAISWCRKLKYAIFTHFDLKVQPPYYTYSNIYDVYNATTG